MSGLSLIGTGITITDAGLPGTGTVTTVSVASANGLAGTVANATTTPAITLSTSITGILQGNGTAISAATTTGSGAVVLAGAPTFTSTIATAAPAGASAGLWKLGSVVTGAVTPDATKSLFVDVGGVVVKLIVAS